MIVIGSVKEDLNFEKRISITSETLKKFNKINFSTNLEKDYAKHLGLNDEEMHNNGAIFSASKKEVFEKSDIILKVNYPSIEEANLIKNKSILIGQLDINNNKDIIKILIQKEVKIFSLNLLPRISRAQSMDVLSSQANLAGYKAVIESFAKPCESAPNFMWFKDGSAFTPFDINSSVKLISSE